MRKTTLFKRFISLLLAILIITGAFCGTIGTFSTFADDFYVDKSEVFDIFNQNITGTSKSTYSRNQLNNNVTGLPSGKHSYIPYNKGAEMIWNIENLTAFSVNTFNNKSITEQQLVDYYVFEASPDGEEWTKLTTVKDAEYVQNFINSNVSYKLYATDIPEGTNYIRMTSTYSGSSAWLHGIIHAECSYKEKVIKPEITATYKNYYGVYANKLASGGRAVRDVRVRITDVATDIGGKVTVIKDGNEVKADDYFNSDENAYCFTEDGEYSITAENYAGNAQIEFKLNKVTEDFVVTKTVVDDIYNNGTTMAISRTDTADATSKVVMNLTSSSASNITHLIPGDKYFMWPYNHGKSEPMAEAVWYSEIGFGNFTVETLNSKSTAVGDFYEKTYSFYTSEDGQIWNKADFKVGNTLTDGINASGISKELIVEEIPDGTKYVKFLSLITDDTKHNGYLSGIIRASYTTYVLLPEINACFKDSLGSFTNPLTDGATAPSDVKLDITDIEFEVFGSLTVKKDGVEIPFENGSILTEDGEYEVYAMNLKGENKLTFKIDSSLATTRTETYVFSEGVVSSAEEFDRLLAEQPEGAPEGFTKGDNHVLINDTAIIRNYDKAWWGLTEGGTKLTIGSDTTTYYKDGYFYFVNKDENGNKYNGISLKYTKARMSGYPTNAYFTVYTADSFDGEYTLVKPTTVTSEPYTGAPAAQVHNAVYYLGSAGSVVKIKFNPDAPVTELWKGSFLAILELSKLTLPLIEAKSNKETLVNNDVTKSNVKLNLSDEYYWFITKDGKNYEKPADNILREDGYYTVTACNYGGTSTVSFYIAKKIPVVRLVDATGNNLDNGETTDGDVKVIAYNSDKTEILKDGVPYSTENEVLLDLNGKYTIIAENENGYYEASVTVNRPMPTVKAYNLRGKQITDGDTIVTKVTYAVENEDTCVITLDGKEYTPESPEAPLTEEGLYVITVENKAGTASISFTIKYNPPLPELKHPGNVVEHIDYENGSKFGAFNYQYQDTLMDAGKALQTDWTGFTGPVVRSTLTGDASGFITYKCAGFKSFAVYAVYLPAKDMVVSDMYEIHASSNGVDFTKLSYTEEYDISYVTTGYEKYRLVAQDIPDNTKYIKVVINGQNATAAWSRCIPKVEFSYNKEDVGKLDIDDLCFMLQNAAEGSEVQIDLRNTDTVIPKEVFELIQYVDITLTVNLLDENLERKYRLSFNGLEMEEAMDFNIKINSPENDGLKAMKTYDKNAQSVSFAQKGEWTMVVQLTMIINPRDGGKRYALYSYRDGEFELVDRIMAPATGYLIYYVYEGGDYIFTVKTDLLDKPTDDNEDENPSPETPPSENPEDNKPEKDDPIVEEPTDNDEPVDEGEEEIPGQEEPSEDEKSEKPQQSEKPSEEKEEPEEKDDETPEQSEPVIENIITETIKDEQTGTYIMVVNRKKFVPASVETSGLATWVIVLICVGAVSISAGVATTIILLIKRNKKKAIGGK